MKNFKIHLEEFEGPFDLLFKLIEKNKINIYDIPISKLTDQYLQQIKTIKNIDMEEMSSFILLAATLLEIKSKTLLPKKQDNSCEKDIDPRDELVQKLIEYKKFKQLAEQLKMRDTNFEQHIFRQFDKTLLYYLKKPNETKIEDILKDIDLTKLYLIFKDVLNKKELKTDKIRSGFNSVTKSLFNINDKIDYLKNLLILNKQINFNKILLESSSKTETIVSFLAMLELIKEKNISVLQNKIFDEIIITTKNEED